MKNLNIFSLFTLECLQGFSSRFTNFEIISNYSFENMSTFLSVEKDHKLFRFINTFSFYFSPKFRALCFKDCMKTKSYIPLFLALKIYQTNLLIPKLTLYELKKIDSISHFKKDLLVFGVISEESIDELIGVMTAQSAVMTSKPSKIDVQELCDRVKKEFPDYRCIKLLKQNLIE